MARMNGRRVEVSIWIEQDIGGGAKEGLEVKLVDATPGQVAHALLQIAAANPHLVLDPVAQKAIETGRLPCAANATNHVFGTGRRGGITPDRLTKHLAEVTRDNPTFNRGEISKQVAADFGVQRNWINVLRKEWDL